LIIAERELLEKTLNGSVKVLTDVLALVDPDAFSRSHRMRDDARQIASALAVPFTWELKLAALLCQIGIVSLPPILIPKARSGLKLTGTEEEMLSRVPEVGGDLLANIPRLESVARIVHCREKRFDGQGVPQDALQGEQIPIEARMLKVLIRSAPTGGRQHHQAPGHAGDALSHGLVRSDGPGRRDPVFSFGSSRFVRAHERPGAHHF
jgi:response regulator RpfG family c-di-GMP phosphodiesterase